MQKIIPFLLSVILLISCSKKVEQPSRVLSVYTNSSLNTNNYSVTSGSNTVFQYSNTFTADGDTVSAQVNLHDALLWQIPSNQTSFEINNETLLSTSCVLFRNYYYTNLGPMPAIKGFIKGVLQSDNTWKIEGEIYFEELNFEKTIYIDGTYAVR